MTSKIVQVKPHVQDPDFPTRSLEHMHLKYIKSFAGNGVLFEFVDAPQEYIEMCKRKGLNHKVICLDRSDVFWHEKDWTNSSPVSSSPLSCYAAVKRNRR
uniref:Uncharacterized protein n=1 Tax=viral metagenome TaxID=1070528 RepID=A0A6C0B3H4_9ZZZZ